MSALIIAVLAMVSLSTLPTHQPTQVAECSFNCADLPKAEGYRTTSMAVKPKG